MSWNTWGRWGAALLVVGCGSKLQVDTNPAGGGGAGGSSHDEGGGKSGVTMTDPNPPGMVGMRCIPSRTTTEATGTVEQADILELAHCSLGLTCGTDGLCEVVPDCPQTSGACVVSRIDPTSAAGSGAGGSGGASSGGAPSFGGNGAALTFAESGVQALVADDSHAYWIEYGTRDALGNYANDGALKAFDGKATTTLSSNLPGPVALGLTSRYAYVYVDGASLLGTSVRPQLLRVPLGGGKSELVQDGAVPQGFVGAGDRAFWTRYLPADGGPPGAIYSMTAGVGAAPSAFVTNLNDAENLAVDETNIYYIDVGGSGQIEAAPIAGGPAVSTGVTLSPFVVRGDFFYALDAADSSGGVVLDQAPKAGGMVRRLRGLGTTGGDMRVVGDRYFWARYQSDDTELVVLTASFVSSDPVERVLDVPMQPHKPLWAVNAAALYWSDGSAIYSRSVADLP